MMERAEGQHSIDNGLDSGRGVGSGFDRGRVDIVVDYVDKNSCPWRPTPDTKDKKSTRTQQQLQRERKVTTAMTVAITNSPSNNTAMPGRPLRHPLTNRDLTRQYAVGNSTPRNKVCIFLLNYDSSINRVICTSSS